MQTEIKNSITTLKQKGTLLYPTDTIWGIGCDATNYNAVEKVFRIKKRKASKSMIVLVDSLRMLKRIITTIPESVLDILKTSTKPTSIIYQNPIGLAQNVIANDNTVAIRIVQNEFCRQLIEKFGKPIISTSANTSGFDTPNSFSDIESEIIENVDYVVALQQNEKSTKSSRILKVTDNGSIEILRD